MEGWKTALLSDESSIADAIRVLEANASHICLVVDSEGRLRGTITDGDVRRGLLRMVPLTASVREVMRTNPIVSPAHHSAESRLELMHSNQIRQLPIVNEAGCILGLATLDELETGRPRENLVVLMAGGLGLRLRPFTERTPKPMLKVGTKPLLETTLESFLQQNFRHFYISVNYLADSVKEYFGDGSRWDCEIRYLEEAAPLGTAGALSLMSETPSAPLIVMNGDVLTKVNFNQLLEFHSEHNATATVCVREYDFQVPYGVVQLDGARINGLTEKPVYSFFVNAGIYVIEPELLGIIPDDGRCFHMTNFLESAMARNREIAAFPIREYWIDIGQLDDFTRANGDFDGVFMQSKPRK